ncbi:MAG TPA: transglutaminase domain-containing protein [Rhodocyclaceae bacterium]
MDRRRFLVASALATWSLALRAEEAGHSLRRVRWGLTIENPTAVELAETKVWLYAPVAACSTQSLRSLNVSAAFTRHGDVLGNTIIELDYPSLSPFASKVVAFDASLDLRSDPLAEPVSHRDYWLRGEAYLEVDAPPIRALASRLLRTTADATARAIYEWVASNIAYAGYIADDMGALYALQERRGDCTEYAYLVTALARAVGIPARALGGYVTPQDAVLRPSEYHNWAELYFDGAWQRVDAQKSVYREGGERYVAFEIISSQVRNALNGAHRYSIEGQAVVRAG